MGRLRKHLNKPKTTNKTRQHRVPYSGTGDYIVCDLIKGENDFQKVMILASDLDKVMSDPFDTGYTTMYTYKGIDQNLAIIDEEGGFVDMSDTDRLVMELENEYVERIMVYGLK